MALARWLAAGLPSNPRAWLVNVGRNKAIDRVRRNVSFRNKQQELAHELLLQASAPREETDSAARRMAELDPDAPAKVPGAPNGGQS